MGRAPCCEKMGLKKGPWTKEEDHILISYISQHGHENWRALPKKAGLLRCGKSCRLRWINYLRPDIKRGNFSKEEEDTIIKLHQALGNRWSAIAARLPGRTDNEIKNVWHTYLKKKLKQGQAVAEIKQERDIIADSKAIVDHQDSKSRSLKMVMQEEDSNQSSSSHSSCDDISYTSSSTTSILENPMKMSLINSDAILNNNPEFDQDFWLDVVSSQDHSDIVNHGIKDSTMLDEVDRGCGLFYSSTHDDMDFWCNLITRTDDISELLEF